MREAAPPKFPRFTKRKHRRQPQCLVCPEPELCRCTYHSWAHQTLGNELSGSDPRAVTGIGKATNNNKLTQHHYCTTVFDDPRVHQGFGQLNFNGGRPRVMEGVVDFYRAERLQCCPRTCRGGRGGGCRPRAATAAVTPRAAARGDTVHLRLSAYNTERFSKQANKVTRSTRDLAQRPRYFAAAITIH